MTDTKNPPPSKPTLTLKPRTETGVVRQSFSHGRTKAVVVEKVRRRANPGDAKPVEAAAPAAAPAAPRPTAKAATPAPAAPAATPAPAPAAKSGVVLRTLTEEERVARTNALADSRVREAEERKIAEEEARRRAEREAHDKVEREAAEARKREEDERHKHDDDAKRRAEQEASKRLGGAAPATPAAASAATPAARTPTTPASRAAVAATEPDDDEAPRPRRGVGGAAARPPTPPKPTRGAPQKQRGRLTLVTALSADDVRERSVASFRRRTQRMTGHRNDEQKEKLVREVTIQTLPSSLRKNSATPCAASRNPMLKKACSTRRICQSIWSPVRQS